MLPEDLAALLLGRVERLSDPAQRVLRAAAVAGRRADDELIRAASGLPLAEYEEAIRETVTQQLLVPEGDGYSFRHALLREAVEADLLPGERTRLHGVLAGLLADDERLATQAGTAAELAHHYLASHDIPGAYAASIRAGAEAEQLGAPAEAHRHYDQALALWDRIPDAEERGGVSRGQLVLYSANGAAASGDVVRAVHQLRTLWASFGAETDPVLVARVGRAAGLLPVPGRRLRGGAGSDGGGPGRHRRAARAPADGERARAIATYASTLMNLGFEDEAAAEWAERGAGRGTGRGRLLGRSGRAGHAGCAGPPGRPRRRGHQAVRRRATRRPVRPGCWAWSCGRPPCLSRAQLERGELTDSARVAHEGVRRADETGLTLAPYGLDVQHLHFQAHYAQGEWDHAQELSNEWAVRVATLPEAVLSAMALFIDVARGNAVAAERRVWLEPLWDQDKLCAYMARAMYAEQALWQGDTGLGGGRGRGRDRRTTGMSTTASRRR